MAEPYSDEELASGDAAAVLVLDEHLSAESARRLSAWQRRWVATLDRLQRERDEANAKLNDARRVARVLATHAYESCSKPECPDARCIAKRTALAYPEVPHG